jgi:DNA-binding transcriptional regulator GbsR (MarR family)
MLDGRSEAFVETVGEFFPRLGHQRIAGRLNGWLLICDPPHQSADELARAIGASKGSISTNLRLLMASGLVERIGISGERRAFYHLRPIAWTRDLSAKLAQVAELRRIADTGLEVLKDRPAEQRKGFKRMRDFYAFMGHELPVVIDKWLASHEAQET